MKAAILKNKIVVLGSIGILSLIFVLVRVRTLNHLLVWDEAWSILSLRAFLLNAVRDPFYWGNFFHPPLYMTFGKFLEPFKENFDGRLQLLSLFFSYGTLIVTYLLSARLGGIRFAFFGGLFFALMPECIAYSTWIKSDMLASGLGYLAVFFILKRKFFWCATALSLSLLAKENALFFVAAVTFLIFFLKIGKPVKKLFMIYAIILLLTSWWYVGFSEMTRNFINFFFSKAVYGELWMQSPSYYLNKLSPDLGVGILSLAVIGISYFTSLIRKGQRRWVVPVIVFLCVYIPISLIFTTKTPWLSISAIPALAMLAGGGALYLLKNFKKSPVAKIVLLLSILFTLITAVSFSYSGYQMRTYLFGWPGAEASRELATYLNKHMRDDENLMITTFAYWKMPVCPVFLYYWKSHPVQIIDGKKKAGWVIDEIVKNKISWFVIADSPDMAFNFHELTDEMHKMLAARPEKVYWSYVWDVRGLSGKNLKD